MNKYLAIDAGGSALKYAVIDENLNFSAHGSVPAETSSRESTFAAIKNLWDNYGEGCVGLAMSIPGAVDRKRGWAYSGGAFLWVANEPYAQEVSEACGGIPVTILNDAKAAAMAEMGYGNLKEIANGIVFVLGTGVGGAIVLNHQLIQGSHFTAGEFSFLRGDYLNRDGQKDCMAFSNGIAGLKACIKETSGLEDIDGLKAFQLIKEEHNEAVKQGVRKFCDILCFYLYNLQTELDVDRILIGGGISKEPMFLEILQEAMDARFADTFYPLIQKPELMTCKYYNDANLIGAVYNFQDVMKNA